MDFLISRWHKTMHEATGSMPAVNEEVKKDEVPAEEPEMNEPVDDVPSEPVDDALDGSEAPAENGDTPAPAEAANPEGDAATPAEGQSEMDPNGPDPVIEPVNE